MTSVFIPSNTLDDTSDSTQPPKQWMPASTQNHSHKAADTFVLGNRSRLMNLNDQQQYTTTTNTHRVDDTGYEVDLLKHLSDDFAQLLHRTDISDCLLNVKGTYMAVHRCVLAARSSTFAAVISGNINRLDTDTKDQLTTLTEKDKLVISIGRTDPEIMKQVIIFMYTSKCDLNERNAYPLLDASGRYDIKSLKVHTGRYLANRINTNNFFLLINAADKYKNALVKQKCIEYFIDHAKEIMDVNQLWKKFAEEHPPIVAELLYWSVNKNEFRQTIPQSDSQW